MTVGPRGLCENGFVAPMRLPEEEGHKTGIRVSPPQPIAKGLMEPIHEVRISVNIVLKLIRALSK